MCLTYDGFKTISNSVKYLISKGDDYEDPEILMRTMRNQKFIGCSGEVYFIKSENSRNKPSIALLQLELNSSSSNYTFRKIAKFSKFSVIAAELINKPTWPLGLDSVPSNYRISNYCLYKNSYRSIKSMQGLYTFSSVLLLIVIVSSYISLKKFNHEIDSIPENVNLSNHDVYHYGFLILQFLQLLALEPSKGLLTRTTEKLNLQLGFDFIDGFSLMNENYWKFYLILLCFVGIYDVLTIILVMADKFYLRLIKSCSLGNIFIEYILPIAGHLLFMPIILMLLSIFRCEIENDNENSEFAFSQDCSKLCYKENHLIYMVIGSIFLIIYLTLSSYLRPYWELKQSHLNIKTKVSFLSCLSIFQLLSVLIKVILNTSNELLQSIFLSCLIFFFIISTFIIKPFNYERLNIALLMILITNLWILIITSSELALGYESEMLILMICGIFFVIIAGLKVQSKYPKRFQSDPVDAIPFLIKFQFSNKLQSYLAAVKYLKGFNQVNDIKFDSTEYVI